MNIKFVVFIFSLILIGSRSAQATYHALGGHVVLCAKNGMQTNQAFIDYLTQERQDNLIGGSTASTSAFLNDLLIHLEIKNPSRSKRFRKYWSDFNTDTIFTTGIELHSTENYLLAPDCRLAKVLAQRAVIRPGEKPFLVDSDLWKTLSPATQSYVLLETFFYKEIYNGRTSYTVLPPEKLKELIFRLFGQKQLPMWVDDYIRLMVDLGFGTLDILGAEMLSESVRWYQIARTAHLVEPTAFLTIGGNAVLVQQCDPVAAIVFDDVWLAKEFCLGANTEFRIPVSNIQVTCLANTTYPTKLYYGTNDAITIKACVAPKGSFVGEMTVLQQNSYVQWDTIGNITAIWRTY